MTESPKGTLRLYDKNFNLLAEWDNGENLYFVEEGENGRRSGVVTAINFEEAPRV